MTRFILHRTRSALSWTALLAVLLAAEAVQAQQTFVGTAQMTGGCSVASKRLVGFVLDLEAPNLSLPNLQGAGVLTMFGGEASGKWARSPISGSFKAVQTFTASSGTAVIQVSGVVSFPRSGGGNFKGTIALQDLATGCVEAGKARAIWRP